MLRALALFILALGIPGCDAPGNPNAAGPQPRTESAADLELRRAWEQFARAVQANDLPALRRLSAECVVCTECVTNTAAEEKAWERYMDQHPTTGDQVLYGSLRYVPAEAFWRQDGPLIFDAKTKERLQNPAKLGFSANDHNKGVYMAPCLIQPAQAASSHVFEVLLTYLDPYPAGQGEGMQKAFAFVKTKQGYKFCGYSTIP